MIHLLLLNCVTAHLFNLKLKRITYNSPSISILFCIIVHKGKLTELLYIYDTSCLQLLVI